MGNPFGDDSNGSFSSHQSIYWQGLLAWLSPNSQECIELPTWEAGTRHKISEIWEFMKPNGGCTNSGEIFWRLEEQKFFSFILENWN
uniref:AlNc14C432G11599 protein n=1 Tax=Albugo laibachii Nc14 TaxID=890382 RepID=F0WZK8_9STRA|nr:AlNc14C432G11599 [Albugo laibachii Nc14]|eukprot:CCA26932.1 AlNc14C432G11599 [Albugo laibachii Nc14]